MQGIERAGFKSNIPARGRNWHDRVQRPAALFVAAGLKVTNAVNDRIWMHELTCAGMSELVGQTFEKGRK